MYYKRMTKLELIYLLAEINRLAVTGTPLMEKVESVEAADEKTLAIIAEATKPYRKIIDNQRVITHERVVT